MKASSAKLLEEFVNRDAEIDDFRRMLSSKQQSIFMVQGDGGVGKSYLQAKMIHEVSNKELIKAEIDVTETRHNDYLSIMRKIRDDIGPGDFYSFTDRVNFYTVPQYNLKISVESSGVSVLDRASLEHSKVRDIAGVIIQDVMLVAPRDDRPFADNERMTGLTDAFLICLASAAESRQIVIFFDATEKMNGQTEEWLWSELLEATRSERLSNVKFVLCGKRMRPLSRNWRGTAVLRELKPITLEFVVEYLKRRGVVDDYVAIIADTLLAVTQGNLLGLANAVDGLPEKYIKTDRQG